LIKEQKKERVMKKDCSKHALNIFYWIILLKTHLEIPSIKMTRLALTALRGALYA